MLCIFCVKRTIFRSSTVKKIVLWKLLQNLYQSKSHDILSPREAVKKRENLGQLTVGGWGRVVPNFYKSLFVWHILLDVLQTIYIRLLSESRSQVFCG